MAVTRIKNNQITDATVVANAKLVDYSISSAKLSNNLTYNSNLTITGNLTVQGTTTAVDTVNTLIQDPILVLADGQTAGTPTVDIGILGYRGNQNSSFIGWKESQTTFMAILSNTTVSNTTVNVTSYANFTASTITAQANLSVIGNIVGAANFSGNITAPNIFSTGLVSATGNVIGGNLLTAGLVSATGNVTGGNVTTAGLVSATGNVTGGNILSAGIMSSTANITGGNLLTNGLISATSTITSSANITGGNVLTGGIMSSTGNGIHGNVVTGGVVTATGNITGGNLLTGGQVSAAGNVTAGAGSFFIGNGSQLTGVAASSASFPVSNGTSNINAAVNSNITVGVAGTSNVAVFASTGVFVTGVNSVSGNITGGNLLTAGLISATGNVTGGNVLTGGLISATSTITSAANITGGNITTAGLITATGNITGGNLITGAAITAAGNITGGNILTGGAVSATGNVTGGNVNTAALRNGAGALTISTGSGAINLQPASGNIVLTANTYINNVASPVQAADAATKQYVDNAVSTQIAYHQAVTAATTANLATTTSGTITYNNGSNGVGATITTTGSFNLIDTANVQTANTRILVKDEGNAALNGVYVWSNATVITRSTDADEYGPNSPEQLSINDYFFVTSGNVNKGSAYVVDAPSGVITFGTSNITFAQFSSSQTYTAGNGISINGTVILAKTDNNTTSFDGGGNIIVKAGANLTTPNIGAATGTSLSVTANVTGGNLVTGGLITATGNITGGNVTTAGLVTATGNVTGGNILTAGLISATSTITSAANITGGNLLTGGLISATSTITSAANITGGNITTAGLITATGNITGGNILSAGIMSSTGNGIHGNILTGGLISATSTITSAANVIGGNISTAGLVTATGNIQGGNLLTGGLISATSTITSAANITGGNLLTGGLISATSTITSAANVTGANITTAGLITATGNITGGNLLTGGLISATSTITSAANITGGNILTGGLVSATANVTGGNIRTAGLITATGNILGGNLILAGAALDTSATRLTVNSTLADADFAVNGTAANIFYVDAGANTASFGASTQVTNAIVNFATTNSVKFPVGNTAQRPSTGVTGMIRFNTTTNAVEVYDNSQWTSVGVPVFTVIADEQFNGDGATVAFTLGSSQTTNSCIVSINGVVQIPTSAYSVSGTTLTFTEAPASGDLIDVREITTTTTVTSISNTSGNAVISVSPTAAQIQTTGDIIPTANATANIGSSSFQYNTIFAKATSAQYADLAEKYAADATYEPGTVVMFGGTAEVTLCVNDACPRVAGVISTNPSYRMNDGLVSEHTAMVALTGRVPTRVTGPVRKGDLMVSAGNGQARAEADPRVGTVIGKALADSEGDAVIEIVVGRV